jgi:chitin-binding protein
VSKQGFNPTIQTLGWGNLDFITQTGRFAPAQDITFPVRTSGYTGHRVLFVIWQASHLDQAYMWCSDVNFGWAGERRTRHRPPSGQGTRSDTLPRRDFPRP